MDTVNEIYTLIDPTSKIAIFWYLTQKYNQLDIFRDFPEPNNQSDWIDVFWLASRFGDSHFFSELKFPNLETFIGINDTIPQMPMEAYIHYAEKYLLEIFHCGEQQSFNKKWTNFCTTHPSFAYYLWSCMDRGNLLDISGDVPIKKKNMMKNCTFDELVIYFNNVNKPRKQEDPKEELLRNNLRREYHGSKHRSSTYYDGNAIHEAEVALDKYLSEKKKAEQRKQSIQAVKKWKENKYINREYIKIDVNFAKKA